MLEIDNFGAETAHDLAIKMMRYGSAPVLIESTGGALAPARLRVIRFQDGHVILCNSDARPGESNLSEALHL